MPSEPDRLCVARLRRKDRNIRIGLVTSAVSRNGGGVFEAVAAQAMLLQSLGHDPVVLGIADEHTATDQARLSGVEVRTARGLGPPSIGLAPRLHAVLMAARLDIVHLHGIWQPTSLATLRWTRRTGGAYVISPHGMLDPWITARGRIKKWAARIAYERASWRRATCFHALTGAEADDIRRATGRPAVTVIPNAVIPQGTDEPQERDRPFILYLSRIHPKKNINALLDAWAGIGSTARGDWRLVICGWGEQADVAHLQARLAAAGDPSIRFAGPIFGPEKWKLLRDASFAILPSLSEGLPMAILEAWAAGTPTMMSRACHLDQGFAAGAAIDCGTDANSIAAALCNAIAMPQAERTRMTHAARHLVATEFSVHAVGQQWLRTYSAAMQPGLTPDT